MCNSGLSRSDSAMKNYLISTMPAHCCGVAVGEQTAGSCRFCWREAPASLSQRGNSAVGHLSHIGLGARAKFP